MLHWIAFIVIGLVVGFIVGSQRRANRTLAVILGLVGGIVGGLILENGVGGSTGKYGSLLTSIVLAAILAFVGRGIGSRSR